MPRQLGGAMLGMTCPWSRSRTVDVGSDFKDMRKSTSCIRHMLKASKASIREVMDEVHLSGLTLLTQFTTVECSVDQRDGRLGIVYFDHKL
jgi:hypothetical protein